MIWFTSTPPSHQLNRLIIQAWRQRLFRLFETLSHVGSVPENMVPHSTQNGLKHISHISHISHIYIYTYGYISYNHIPVAVMFGVNPRFLGQTQAAQASLMMKGSCSLSWPTSKNMPWSLVTLGWGPWSPAKDVWHPGTSGGANQDLVMVKPPWSCTTPGHQLQHWSPWPADLEN